MYLTFSPITHCLKDIREILLMVKNSRIWTHTAHIKLIKTENNRFDITFSQTEKKLSKN